MLIYPHRVVFKTKRLTNIPMAKGKIIVLVYFLGTRETAKNQVNKGLLGQYIVVLGNEKHKI